MRLLCFYAKSCSSFSGRIVDRLWSIGRIRMGSDGVDENEFDEGKDE